VRVAGKRKRATRPGGRHAAGEVERALAVLHREHIEKTRMLRNLSA